MNKNTCGQCGHFRRHYVLDEQSCTAVCCGHCVFPRVKNRRPDTGVPNKKTYTVAKEQRVLQELWYTLFLCSFFVSFAVGRHF